MPGTGDFVLFLGAASVLAATPGLGLFFVAARTLAGGRGEGLASSFGTGLGGCAHVAAGALGVSALIMANAEAFASLKLAGAAYLLWLCFKTIREARAAAAPLEVAATGAGRAFREGVVVEALNPKTAAFFLAFVPQFVDPSAGGVALQFAAFGLVSVALNTFADVVVTVMASRARGGLSRRPDLIRRLRATSGVVICGLGASLAFARRPS